MPNDFYTRVYSPLPEQRVSSQVLKDEFARVEVGFNKIQNDTNRAIKLPVGTADQTLAMDAVARANLVLAFNASGNITAISYGRFRGDWLTATAYVVSDYFRDPVSKNVYATVTAHTSGVLATDIAANRVQLAINVADVEAAKTDAQTAASTATTQAGLASTSASTATTQAGIATTKAGEASASAGTASADASTATTQAGIATTKAGEANASAIAAAASAASIAGGPVASVNGRTGVVTGVQDTLVSGTNIKTINSTSLLGAGDIAVGSSITRSARTSNTVLGVADKGKLIDITSGTFSQTFDAVATLGDGWWCYLRNSGTGVVTLDPNAAETIDGVATKALDPGQAVIVQCDGTALRTVALEGVGNHVVRLDTGNGMGSTNTKIRRFTTTTTNVGTAITYADSSTLGASFTINEAGLYAVTYSDVGASGLVFAVGISVNSTQLTTNVGSITAAHRVALASSAALEGMASVVTRLAAGDVVRPHFGINAVESANAATSFTIRKVGI